MVVKNVWTGVAKGKIILVRREVLMVENFSKPRQKWVHNKIGTQLNSMG
jgi:hypothetical protein